MKSGTRCWAEPSRGDRRACPDRVRCVASQALISLIHHRVMIPAGAPPTVVMRTVATGTGGMNTAVTGTVVADPQPDERVDRPNRLHTVAHDGAVLGRRGRGGGSDRWTHCRGEPTPSRPCIRLRLHGNHPTTGRRPAAASPAGGPAGGVACGLRPMRIRPRPGETLGSRAPPPTPSAPSACCHGHGARRLRPDAHRRAPASRLVDASRHPAKVRGCRRPGPGPALPRGRGHPRAR